MANEMLLGLAVGGFAGLVVGIVVTMLFRKAPNVEQLARTVSELQRQLEEWQRTTATQQQVEQVRSNLSSAQTTLAQVETWLRNLVNFTQQNLQPQVNQQLQQALGTLNQVQQALHDARHALSQQSQSDEHRHGQLMDNLQTAQKALSSLQTLLGEVSENLRIGQQQLSESLQSLRGDVSVAKETVQSVAEQVKVLTTLQHTALRVEENVNRLTAILTGRRSGQAGEQIVGELLKAIPDDWLERKAKLGTGEVEFAIKMPGGCLIPLDSKFVRPELVEQLEGDEISNERRQNLLRQVRDEVRTKAKEVAERYLSDEKVLGFGIAAVPDSVYDLCRDAVRASAQQHRIVIVPYSLLLPFTLSLYLMAQRLGISRLGVTEQTLGTMKTNLEKAKQTLENMAKGITSVSNQRQQTLQQVEQALVLLSQLTRGDIALPEAEERSSNSLSGVKI
ncbi:MAG: DNA recombination protein RmuC [Armatimonadetes bacterium]|nr:DNA recombination protein RmuC [Armatimonadota bacterium]